MKKNKYITVKIFVLFFIFCFSQKTWFQNVENEQFGQMLIGLLGHSVEEIAVVEILEKSYGLKIEVTKSELLEKSITANIPKNDPELMLQAIAAIYEITLSHKEGKFILE